MMPSNTEDYMLVAKMGLTNLKIVIQLLKAINFKEVLKICAYVRMYLRFFCKMIRNTWYYLDSYLPRQQKWIENHSRRFEMHAGQCIYPVCSF